MIFSMDIYIYLESVCQGAADESIKTPKSWNFFVKDHKPVAAGKNIPKLREIVSGSGSNTEYISAYLKPHKTKLET